MFFEGTDVVVLVGGGLAVSGKLDVFGKIL